MNKGIFAKLKNTICRIRKRANVICSCCFLNEETGFGVGGRQIWSILLQR